MANPPVDYSKMSDADLDAAIHSKVGASISKKKPEDMSDTELDAEIQRKQGISITENPVEAKPLHQDWLQGGLTAAQQMAGNVVYGAAKGIENIANLGIKAGNAIDKYDATLPLGRDHGPPTPEIDLSSAVKDFAPYQVPQGEAAHPMAAQIAQGAGSMLPTIPAAMLGSGAVAAALPGVAEALPAMGPIGQALIKGAQAIPGGVQTLLKLTSSGAAQKAGQAASGVVSDMGGSFLSLLQNKVGDNAKHGDVNVGQAAMEALQESVAASPLDAAGRMAGLKLADKYFNHRLKLHINEKEAGHQGVIDEIKRQNKESVDSYNLSVKRSQEAVKAEEKAVAERKASRKALDDAQRAVEDAEHKKQEGNLKRAVDEQKKREQARDEQKKADDAASKVQAGENAATNKRRSLASSAEYNRRKAEAEAAQRTAEQAAHELETGRQSRSQAEYNRRKAEVDSTSEPEPSSLSPTAADAYAPSVKRTPQQIQAEQKAKKFRVTKQPGEPLKGHVEQDADATVPAHGIDPSWGELLTPESGGFENNDEYGQRFRKRVPGYEDPLTVAHPGDTYADRELRIRGFEEGALSRGETTHKAIAKRRKKVGTENIPTNALEAVVNALSEFMHEEVGSGPAFGFLDPAVGWVMDSLMLRKAGIALNHTGGGKDFLKRWFGAQSSSNAIRSFDATFGRLRDEFYVRIERASVDVKDPRTLLGQEQWRDALKMSPEEILNSPELTELDDAQRRFLATSKKEITEFVKNELAPRVEELEKAGVEPGLFGVARYLRMLKDDMRELNPHAKDPHWFDNMLKNARANVYTSVLLGNQEIGGPLGIHPIEALAAGLSHDAGAMAEAAGLLLKGNVHAVDYATAFHTRGMEAKLLEGAKSWNPLARLNTELGDAVVKRLEAMPHGGTIVDLLRAQMAEKAKIGVLRVSLAARQAKLLNYPGGAEALMKDYLTMARGTSMTADKEALLSKAEIGIYTDLNKLIMYSPLGLTEKTIFQRHGEFVKMMTPWTRSVVAQANLMTEYADDVLHHVRQATKELATGSGDGIEHGAQAAKAIGQLMTMTGVLAVFSGHHALPEGVDDIAKATLGREKWNVVKGAMDAMHLPGETVLHVQPKLTAIQAAHSGSLAGDWAKEAGTLLTAKSNHGKIAFGPNRAGLSIGDHTLSFNKKSSLTAKGRALATGMAFAGVSHVGGLVGTGSLLKGADRLAKGFKGRAKAYANVGDKEFAMTKNFKTDPIGGALDWARAGTPDAVAKWQDKMQERHGKPLPMFLQSLGTHH